MNRKQRRAKNGQSNSPSQVSIPLSQQALPQNKTEYLQDFERARKLMAEDNLAESTQLLTKLLKQNPKDYGVMELLGVGSEKLKNYEAAINFFRAAKDLQPEKYALDVAIANLLVNTDQIEEGMALAKTCISDYMDSLSPIDQAAAHGIVGNTYMLLGEKEKAKPHLQKACDIEPEALESLYNYITQVGKPKDKDDTYFQRLREMSKTSDNKRTPHENALLYYGLFDCYDAFQDHEKAFDYAIKGAKYKHEIVGQNKRRIEKLFSVTKAYFNESFFKNQRYDNCPSDIPVFIVGMPRSGTTLLQQILHAHPDVESIGEDAVLAHLIKHYSLMEPHNNMHYPFRVSTEVDGYFTPQAIGDKYIDYTQKNHPNAKRVINKAIDTIIYLGYLHVAFPHAKFIHIKRNAMDSCISAFTKSFSGDVQGYSYDMEELGMYYKGYTELMEHWNTVLPGKILNIEYEHIVENLEEKAREAIDFIDLPWSDQCIDFHKAESVVRTASLEQVRKPIYKSSIDRWKKYGPKIIPLIEALGDAAPEEAKKYAQEHKN